ncbi:MAG: SulP family inorganic anion transporter [Thermomicrobiales bacterium]
MAARSFGFARRQPMIVQLLREEFAGYSWRIGQRDLIAGLTVAAVALPLALAFGVASGSTPAAGLVTAIVGGFLIGLLGGAPYQISGPTGAMSAVLIIIAQQHGVRALWIAGLLSGIMILAIGLLKLGRIVNLIPAPVITGFTSGIALVIFIGQIDNFLGIKTTARDRSAEKLLGYFTNPLPSLNWSAIACGTIVILTMVALPRIWHAPGLPTALVGIGLATLASWGMNLQVTTIGAIPSGIILDERLIPKASDLELVQHLIGPAFAITLLGAIESLLCGVVAGRMTGKKLAVNQELVAQGIGNIVLPFVGGVPATAAIARTSVGIKAGGVTRLVSIIHSVALLLSALFLSTLIGHIPLAALAGVLFVTAWRMNEWHSIRFYLRHRLKGATGTLVVTMLATIALDLTQAIVIGLLASLALFLTQVAQLNVNVSPVNWAKLGISPDVNHDVQVVYVSGPLFFASVNQFVERIEELPFAETLILSMRGVPTADVSSVQAIEHLWREHDQRGGTIYITGLQAPVRRIFERAHLVEAIGEDHFLWSADQALRTIAHRSGTTGARTVAAPADDARDDLPFAISPAG